MKSLEVLYQDGDPRTHAIFPHEGVISLVSRMEDGRSAEMTAIGNEGFLGFGLLVGGEATIGASIVQVPGYASWLSAADLNEALDKFECVRLSMLRYAKALIIQLMESVACNSLHAADQRIARMLLHTHDRVIGDTFELTQQTISDALGLRRATVGSVCSRLKKEGAIRYSRGSLTIVDRERLEQFSCECYGRIRTAAV